MTNPSPCVLISHPQPLLVLVGGGVCSFCPTHDPSPRQGQRTLAQGNALGKMSPLASTRPVGAVEILFLRTRFHCPYRAAMICSDTQPRALPWANMRCPYGAYLTCNHSGNSMQIEFQQYNYLLSCLLQCYSAF
jgi:hypothetical protein